MEGSCSRTEARGNATDLHVAVLGNEDGELIPEETSVGNLPHVDMSMRISSSPPCSSASSSFTEISKGEIKACK